MIVIKTRGLGRVGRRGLGSGAELDFSSGGDLSKYVTANPPPPVNQTTDLKNSEQTVSKSLMNLLLPTSIMESISPLMTTTVASKLSTNLAATLKLNTLNPVAVLDSVQKQTSEQPYTPPTYDEKQYAQDPAYSFDKTTPEQLATNAGGSVPLATENGGTIDGKTLQQHVDAAAAAASAPLEKKFDFWGSWWGPALVATAVLGAGYWILKK